MVENIEIDTSPIILYMFSDIANGHSHLVSRTALLLIPS